jgi:hypothetical protein
MSYDPRDRILARSGIARSFGIRLALPACLGVLQGLPGALFAGRYLASPTPAEHHPASSAAALC